MKSWMKQRGFKVNESFVFIPKTNLDEKFCWGKSIESRWRMRKCEWNVEKKTCWTLKVGHNVESVAGENLARCCAMCVLTYLNVVRIATINLKHIEIVFYTKLNFLFYLTFFYVKSSIMSWGCSRIVSALTWRPYIVFRGKVWRGCDGMTNVIDWDLLWIIIVGSWRGRWWWCWLNFFDRIVLISHLSSITVNVVSGVFHDLYTTIRQVNFVASMNRTVFLLLRVRKVIAWVSVFDSVREPVLFLVMIRWWRFDWIDVIVTNLFVLPCELNWLALEFVALNFSCVIGESWEDSWWLIILRKRKTIEVLMKVWRVQLTLPANLCNCCDR